LHGLADSQQPGVRLLLARDHPEQRRLSRPVGPDDADDAATRQGQAQIVHEEIVAVALPHVPRRDDHIAEPRSWRDVNLRRLDLLRGVLPEQVLVGVETRLALGLTRPWRHPDPFELTLQRPLPLRLSFLLLLQSVLLLLEPGRVVAFPRN